MPLDRLPRTLLLAGVAALAAVVTLVASVSPLRAHDFWIEPSSWAPAAGSPLALRLRVGEAFAGEPLPRDPSHAARFAAVGASGEQPVPGAAGSDPAGYLVAAPGAHVVVYGSHATETRLEPAAFRRYLIEEGLDHVRAELERRGEGERPVRERFSRCAKALLRVGGREGRGAGAELFTRPVGLRLELVPDRDPTGSGPSLPGPTIPDATRPLPVRLLYGGEPLAGALVVAVAEERPSARVQARTDAAGRVVLPVGEPGVWLVKAVHMVPAPPGSGADWESFWASLTFEVAKER
jgi:uncharacterized GH25 family protein